MFLLEPHDAFHVSPISLIQPVHRGGLYPVSGYNCKENIGDQRCRNKNVRPALFLNDQNNPRCKHYSEKNVRNMKNPGMRQIPICVVGALLGSEHVHHEQNQPVDDDVQGTKNNEGQSSHYQSIPFVYYSYVPRPAFAASYGEASHSIISHSGTLFLSSPCHGSSAGRAQDS